MKLLLRLYSKWAFNLTDYTEISAKYTQVIDWRVGRYYI